MSTVFIALQTNEDTRQIVDAILQDNPHAVANDDVTDGALRWRLGLHDLK